MSSSSGSMYKEEHPLPAATESKPERIVLLDALRGLSILLMIAYHAGYNLVVLEYIPKKALYNPLLNTLEPLFAGIFIVLAGISSRFSRSNLKRGLIVLGAAILVTLGSMVVLPAPWLALKAAVLDYSPTSAKWGQLILDGKIDPPASVNKAMTAALTNGTPLTPELAGGWMAGAVKNPLTYLGKPITFGILHLMAACILLYALLERLKLTLPAVLLGAFLSGYFTLTRFPQMPSADYFPIVPWGFLFFFGIVLGDPIRAKRFPAWFYRFRVPFFPAVGRHTLLIYMLHQPILYGLLVLIKLLFPEIGISPEATAPPSPTPTVSPTP